MFKNYENYFLKTGIITSAIFGTFMTVDHYKRMEGNTTYLSAMNDLGFNSSNFTSNYTAKHQAEELLKIFNYSGYFEKEKLWQDIVHIGFKHPERVYKSIVIALYNAGIYGNDQDKIDFQYLIENIFKQNVLNPFARENITCNDARDIILYLAQNAFARKMGQERNELKTQDWMVKREQEFFESAKILGLTDQVKTDDNLFNEAWIPGASRVGLLSRIIFFKSLEVKITDKILVMAGQRPIWAEIDGISPTLLEKMTKLLENKGDIKSIHPSNGDRTGLMNDPDSRTDEGIKYIKNLARWAGIELDREEPVITYDGKDCPKGFFPGRHYSNPVNKDNKLTETIMSEHLLSKYLPDATIIDTESKGENRPTTATTARDAAMALVESIQSGHYDHMSNPMKILIPTNQPYTRRQTAEIEFIIRDLLKENGLENRVDISVKGSGFANKDPVAVVNSELGALISLMYKQYSSETPDSSTREISDLLFQSRGNNSIPDLPQPEVSGCVEIMLFDMF